MILVFADEQNEVANAQTAKEALSPFLKNKLLLISEQIMGGTEFLLRNCCHTDRQNDKIK